MNKVKLLFFATLKEKVGTRETELEIPDDLVVSQFKAIILEKFPSLPQGKANLVVAINKEFAFDEEGIPPNAVIALFPPVSGG
jgi:molybdopterin converting factor subunit 1